MDTLIPTSADLAGDPAVISRAEACGPIVEAAADEIEEKRRLPPALLDKLHEARLFRLLLPRSSNGIETDPITFFHVIETIAKADASHRLVPEPGRRLRHVGGLSRPAGGAGDLRQRSARRAGLGPGSAGQGDRMRGRLQGHRRVGLRLGRPACDLARRRTARSGRPTARRGSDANGRQLERTMLVRAERRRMDRHLERRSACAARRATSSR